jgi:integrase
VDHGRFGQVEVVRPTTSDRGRFRLPVLVAGVRRSVSGALPELGFVGTLAAAGRDVVDEDVQVLKRLVKQAGIDQRISPHSLRHSFITAALDAGVPLRDVQEAASHADPRTTMRYDRARRSLDRHATYIVSTFVAGATRPV